LQTLLVDKQTNKGNKKKKVRCLLGSRSCSCVGPAPSSTAPSSCSKLPSKLPYSKLVPARHLWSSDDGVRGGGFGRW
jgi:hypothetical protein